MCLIIHSRVPCIYIYKPTVWPVASRNLFLDIQVMKLLFGQFTLFARANLYYPTIRPCSYFSTIFVAHLPVRWDVRETVVHLCVLEDDWNVHVTGTFDTNALQYQYLWCHL